MPLLNLISINKSYGAQWVLRDVSLQLHHGEKAGLIGPNGSGKTTLLQIIAGRLEPDGGDVHLARGATVGYLPQKPDLVAGGSLRQHLERPLHHLFELKKQIEHLEREIAALSGKEGEEPAVKRLLARYGELRARFEASEGYRAESRILAVARGLGFGNEDLEREPEHFSGGEKTRARLAELLLQEPDLLLLDEPTNFLDLEGVEWLERYLRDWPRGILVVSHDRYFLDRVVNRIFALENHKLKSYSGNYSCYLTQREQEHRELQRSYRKQQELLAREERLIRESKADERSKRQARSRQRRLEKLVPVERPAAVSTFNLNFNYAGRSGNLVVTFVQVAKSFGQKTLFRDLSFEIRRGDRVALVGPNGAGKTTLLKLIAGDEKPSAGEIRIGSAVKVSYFAQEQELLDPERTLVEEITAAGLDLKTARHHLGRYLFRGDDVFKRVGDLSGGEKSRLALARLALDGGNCLLMDEPTGHLDLPAVEELEKALQGYPGTLIVVSHDRYFLHKLSVNRVLELRPGGLDIFEGDFAAYLERRETSAGRVASPEESKEFEKKRRIEEHRRRQERQRREKKLKEEQARLEEAIAAAEENIARLEEQLSDPARYGDLRTLSELGEKLEKEKAALAGQLRRWEEVSLQLENLS